MTNASSAQASDFPSNIIHHRLLSLVHLMARESARKDFASRCNSNGEEKSHD